VKSQAVQWISIPAWLVMKKDSRGQGLLWGERVWCWADTVPELA